MHPEHALLDRLLHNTSLVVPDLDHELTINGHSVHAHSEETSRDARARHQVETIWLLLHLLAKGLGAVYLPHIEEALVADGENRGTMVRRVIYLPDAC